MVIMKALFAQLKKNRILKAIILLLLVSTNTAYADWYKQEQTIMGTLIKVELWHNKRLQAKKCISLVMTDMQRIDASMSPFKHDSELSHLNRTAATQAVKVSKELFQLVSKANRISEQTHGQFDITFASAGRLYDYRKAIRPSDEQLKNLLEAINYRHVLLDPRKRTIHFQHPQVYVDLGGIAKGHAVDQAIKILRQCGIKHALVSAGGDSRILGDKQGLPWMTGIRHPREKNSFVVLLPLTNTAISTSGDYERYFIEDGVRYHHIISPASGKPANKARSVTILGENTTTTDALSTAIFVMGPQKGLETIETLPSIEAIIIDTKGKVHYTSGLLQPKQEN